MVYYAHRSILLTSLNKLDWVPLKPHFFPARAHKNKKIIDPRLTLRYIYRLIYALEREGPTNRLMVDLEVRFLI